MKFLTNNFVVIFVVISLILAIVDLFAPQLIVINSPSVALAQSDENPHLSVSGIGTGDSMAADLGRLARQAMDKRQASEDHWSEKIPSKILGHLKAKQGKPLVIKAPSVNELLPDQLIPNLPGIPNFKESFKTGSLFTDSEIPNCQSSKSEVKKAKESLTPSGPQVLIDSLYLDSNFITDSRLPKDYKDLFGSNVSITFYRRGEASPINGLLKASGIPCLPYRIRLTTEATMRLSGRDALKSFEDPKSSGKFHPLVAEAVRRLR